MYVKVLIETIYKIKSETNLKGLLMLYQNITSDGIDNYNNGLSLMTQTQSSNKLHTQDDILLIFVKSSENFQFVQVQLEDY